MPSHALPMDQIFHPAKWLSDWLRDWATRLFERPIERREAPRRRVTNLTANYWEGTGPGMHAVRDISCRGAFILADFKWVAGTIVTMTLQFEDQGAGSSSRETTVQARVVRHATEGIGVQFSSADKGEQRRLANFLQSIMPSE